MSAAIVSGLAAYFMRLDPTLQRPGTGLTAAAVKSRLVAESFPVYANSPEFPNAISNGPAILCADSGSGDEDAELGRRDTNDGGSCALSSYAASRSSSPATLGNSKTSTAILGISTMTTAAQSEPSVKLSKPCNDGSWYAELIWCEENCFYPGVCEPPSKRFRRCEGCNHGGQGYVCNC